MPQPTNIGSFFYLEESLKYLEKNVRPYMTFIRKCLTMQISSLTTVPVIPSSRPWACRHALPFYCPFPLSRTLFPRHPLSLSLIFFKSLHKCPPIPLTLLYFLPRNLGFINIFYISFIFILLSHPKMYEGGPQKLRDLLTKNVCLF